MVSARLPFDVGLSYISCVITRNEGGIYKQACAAASTQWQSAGEDASSVSLNAIRRIAHQAGSTLGEGSCPVRMSSPTKDLSTYPNAQHWLTINTDVLDIPCPTHRSQWMGTEWHKAVKDVLCNRRLPQWGPYLSPCPPNWRVQALGSVCGLWRVETLHNGC